MPAPLDQHASMHANAFGLLRVVFALTVVVSHTGFLGFGGPDIGQHWTRYQITPGLVAVFGFFFISGTLVTRSATRVTLPRFLWHRALRLLPALLVCLVVTAFVVAPLLYVRERGTLAGFFDHPEGPFTHVASNGRAALLQLDVSGVMTSAFRDGRVFNPSFDGALWSLKYEVLCYLAVALIAWAGVLLRRRWLIAALAVGAYGVVARDALSDRFWSGKGGAVFDLPFLGEFSARWLVYLAFAFLAGATVYLFRDGVPLSDPLGAACAVIALGTLRSGWFFLFGLPAFLYVVLWASARLPFRGVGRSRDYSYGIYIYGFVVQQSLTLLGVPRWGAWAYFCLVLAITMPLAVASWHFVERPMLRLKSLRAALPIRGRHMPAPVVVADASV